MTATIPKSDPKDPTDVRRYLIDWSGVLPPGQTISGVTVSRTGVDAPNPVPGGGAAEGYTATEIFVWAAGGSAPTTASLEITITTNAGEIIQRTVRVPVRQR
jgi:hypothetical protein